MHFRQHAVNLISSGKSVTQIEPVDCESLGWVVESQGANPPWSLDFLLPDGGAGHLYYDTSITSIAFANYEQDTW
ncbi:uncharacterized protein N7529_001308 [Penicillium soppii]|uniref:uncharacterized protein n=1 Tax=Penicillium soppii TaxID=69789 RepID=UPI0025474C4D|nr:uncharacterized protein N7529_001308 [Penicillium soppii]KAJ5882636.1 hypothetical protein N7529_001308 [Penicillium soppii]